ncbi:MAG: glucosamine-6-phosphate deaminase [Defluviitaleaceae bacterium]|nr:glucosamine-6-phosphate deaminase [Defluviitaleaceae bacterium]
MEKKYKNFKIVIKENYDSTSIVVADIIAGLVNAKSGGVLGLATGGTPVGAYKQLIAMQAAGKVDFSHVTCFNLDEYHPIAASNSQSYKYFMKDNLFNHININPANTHIPDGMAEDVQAECAAYEQKIAAAGGIDLQLLGIGSNGHIGFNEPASAFSRETNYIALEASTIEANARYFNSPDEVPKHALTMGIGTIFAARRIVMMITGAAKANIAEAAILGYISPQVPASILQLHPDVTFVLDADAAKNIIPRIT